MSVCDAAIVEAEPDGRAVKRARPPKWSNDVREVFFNDAREKLVGARPDYSEAARASGAALDGASGSPATNGVSGTTWSKLIDADTIEVEIKRVSQAVAGDVDAASTFKGGAYQGCRRHFSVLAVLFAVAAEHDSGPRWSDVAPALRDSLARAGRNCKVGTDVTYQEARQRSQDLAELIRGGRPQLASSARRTANWGRVADRSPLMQRLEIAYQERLDPWLASEREFDRHREAVRHEAQLVATFAEVIGREGFEYWDDEQYAQYARELRQAAADIAAAADAENYERAKQALGRATSACANCHEGYRG